MKSNDSIFGATPDGLDRLVANIIGDLIPEETSRPTMPLDTWSERAGGQIDGYKLVSVLGEGGMGVVYRAQQEAPIRRQVALKVIKPGMDTKQVIARFEAERQALALLDHPNVARVFQAGTTAGGRPYFVMELVAGVPITEHCDRLKLSIEERLELFLQVCDAVQHAHQKGIIHRDIKPSNILVTLQETRAVPKIIDFGIAKAVTQPLTERTLYTEQGQFVGTPEYMSPEQAEPTAQGIDTRTDIYSLGVVLYELLAGILPFDAQTLREGGPEHIRRVIREKDPGTPSTRLSRTCADTSTEVAALRRTDVRTLRRRLHGDLDWITLKAMEKDPNRRYATAHALAEDIQRHLHNQPVTAGSPGVLYRTQKFLRRHRRKLTAALGFAVLVAGLMGSLAILRTGLDKSRNAEIVRHEQILSEAAKQADRGEYRQALSTVAAILDSPHLGPRARLLHARLRMLDLQSNDVAINANDAQWGQVIDALKGLLGESAEIAGQAHFVLATIYYESDPEAIAGASDDYDVWVHHQRKADAMLPETADSYLLRALSAATGHQIRAFLDKALQLDPGHFESVKARALVHQASANYFQVAMDATLMKSIKPKDSQGYALSALALRELGRYDEALADHERAIELSPKDAGLLEQRYRTHMRMGRYALALEDARACVRMEPSVNLYRMRVLFALVALGQYAQATAAHKEMSVAYNFDKFEFDDWSTQHVFDTLSAGRSWYPSDTMPTGRAFLPMCLADAAFRRFPEKSRCLIRQAEHPCFSPDGAKLAYTVGIHRSTGIAVYDMDSGQSQLLVLPGKDPVWSPDGTSIAYTRNRQTLPLSALVKQRSTKGASDLQDAIQEIWVIKADGTDSPHLVAKGRNAAWSRDSKRIIYSSPTDGQFYSVSVGVQGVVPNLASVRSSLGGFTSPDGAFEFNGPGLAVVDSATRGILGSWPELKVGSLNWSLDSRSLLVGGAPSIWGSNINIGGLWFCDVMSRSLSRVFQDYAFGDAVFPPDPNRSGLVFVLNHQTTVWYREIWMADLSPDDLRRTRAGACQTVAQHHRDIIQSQYDLSIDMDPNEPLNYLLRGARYLKLGDFEKALMDVENFARIEQDRQLGRDSYVNRQLKLIMKRSRFLKQLVDDLASTVEVDSIDRDFPGRKGLAWSFYYQGLWAHREQDYATALERYKTAIRIDPELAAALHQLAIIQATCPVSQWHDPESAVRNAVRACELTDWANTSFMETCAAAHARAGNFNAAVTRQQDALTRMETGGSPEQTVQARAELDLYQQRKTYQQQYLWPNALIAWWKFEAQDTREVRDHSGNDLHGKLMGNACIVSDPQRGAVLSLDGSGDFVDCGRDVRFGLTETLTLSVWIKPRVLSKKHQAIMSNGDRGWILNRTAYANHIQFAGFGVTSSYDPGSLWGHLSTKDEMSDGRWHHLVSVYDGSHLRLYVDGELDATCAATGLIGRNDWPVFIGENSELPNREWDGLIDDVRIYSSVLNAEEVRAIYDSSDKPGQAAK